MLKMNKQSFVSMIQAVQKSAARDDSRPVLAGIHLRLEGGKMTAEAADGFRLSTSSTRLTKYGEEDDPWSDAAAILRKDVLIGFLRLAKDRQHMFISIEPGGQHWTFSQGDVRVDVPCIDGTWPDTQQITAEKGRLHVEVRANATFLSDVLSSHKNEPVLFSVWAEGRPIRVVHEADDVRTEHIVMPMISSFQ